MSDNYSIGKLENIINDGLCMGCGFCTVSLDGNKTPVEMIYESSRGHFIPKINMSNTIDLGEQVICPGATMNMKGLSEKIYDKEPDDPLLGNYKKLRVAYAHDEEVRMSAASGGMIPILLKYLFESNKIDIAYCAIPGESTFAAQGEIITSTEKVNTLSGSIYHSVNFGSSLSELVAGNGRFAFVGLPCEISGLEMLKLKMPELSERHVLSIGLFCGGVNSFEGVEYYLKSFGIAANDIKNIEYRYGKWPGKIRLWLKSTVKKIVIPRIRENTRWKILRYVIAFQGYWMLQRCRMCPDQVSDFADISVGDPHLSRFRKNNNSGISVVITRTNRGESLVKKAIDLKLLCEEEITRDDIVQSQGYTLDNRRHVKAYQIVGRVFRLKSPVISTYSALSKTLSFRHFVYASVDLMKISLSKYKWLHIFYLPWQVFEYLFITFTPSLIVKRIGKLLSNR